MPPAVREVPRLLRIDEVMKIACCTNIHVYRLVKKGKFPRPIKLGLNRVAWDADEVFAWFDEKKAARDQAAPAPAPAPTKRRGRR